jgi:Helix-turn-helix domain of resolvase
MPRTYQSPAVATVHQYGIDQVIERLGQGETQTEIAREIGVSVMTVNRAIHADELTSARVREAQRLSAERWELEAARILEEAQQQIRDEPGISGAIVALARERSQSAYRRASVLDRDRYGDAKRSVDVTVTHTAQLSTADLERIASQALTLLPDGTVEGGTSDIGEAGES